jgi:hypothetical protein
MRKTGVLATVFVLLTCTLVVSQTSRKHHEPCPVKNARSGWPTYVDRVHGFCFSYPPTYAPVAQPCLEKYTHSPDKKSLEYRRKAAQEVRLLRLQNERDTTVSIVFFIEDQPFNLESFVAGAPTGIEDPPEPKHIGIETFYYYGPGGGGVEYPDNYFFDLKGKTLTITFDGPYVNDKTPSLETKNMEEELLGTFRTF